MVITRVALLKDTQNDDGMLVLTYSSPRSVIVRMVFVTTSLIAVLIFSVATGGTVHGGGRYLHKVRLKCFKYGVIELAQLPLAYRAGNSR